MSTFFCRPQYFCHFCLFDLSVLQWAVFGDILDGASTSLDTDQQNKEGHKSAPKSTHKAKEREKDKQASKSSSIMDQVSIVTVCLCIYISMSVSSPILYLNHSPPYSLAERDSLMNIVQCATQKCKFLSHKFFFKLGNISCLNLYT